MLRPVPFTHRNQHCNCCESIPTVYQEIILIDENPGTHPTTVYSLINATLFLSPIAASDW